jgi:hypothetical protein
LHQLWGAIEYRELYFWPLTIEEKTALQLQVKQMEPANQQSISKRRWQERSDKGKYCGPQKKGRDENDENDGGYHHDNKDLADNSDHMTADHSYRSNK